MYLSVLNTFQSSSHLIISHQMQATGHYVLAQLPFILFGPVYVISHQVASNLW